VDNPTWVIGTLEGAMKKALAQGLTVRVVHLHPDDYKDLRAQTLKIRTDAPLTTGGVQVLTNASILRGNTMLECVKLPDSKSLKNGKLN
jgi:hypothetical protein